MLAFHNDPKIKEKYLLRISEHEKADEIIKGTYWEKGKGCAVGCTIHSSDHSAYETELGIPLILAKLEDGIFESLPNEISKTWPRNFLEVIPVGADLSKVWPEFALWLLRDDTYGALQFAKNKEQIDAINSVADLYVLKLEGAEIDINDWMSSKAAAYAAASASAASAASAAYASYAAAYASYFAAAAAAAASDASASASASAAAYDAKKKEWRIAQKDKLLDLLKAAK